MSLYKTGCATDTTGAIVVGKVEGNSPGAVAAVVIGGLFAIFVVIPKLRGTSVRQAWKESGR